MTPERVRRVHFIYSIILSIVLVAAGACLMAGCIHIYRSGDAPFSRESVAAAFSPIAFVVYLCAGTVIAGFLLDFFLPLESGRRKADKQRRLILSRLYAGADLSGCDTGLRQQIEKQRRNRYWMQAINVALLALGTIVFLVYALDGSRFSLADINGSVIRAVVTLALCMMLPFGFSILNAYWVRNSMDKEIKLLKQAPKRKTVGQKPDKIAPIIAARCLFLAVGAAFLLYGFFTGGTADVLVKAINICTECVGLG